MLINLLNVHTTAFRFDTVTYFSDRHIFVNLLSPLIVVLVDPSCIFFVLFYAESEDLGAALVVGEPDVVPFEVLEQVALFILAQFVHNFSVDISPQSLIKRYVFA